MMREVPMRSSARRRSVMSSWVATHAAAGHRLVGDGDRPAVRTFDIQLVVLPFATP